MKPLPARPDPMPTAMGQGRSERGRRPVVTALIAATAIVAMEGTIVATAVPQVTGDLGGLEQIGWVFAAYLLAQSVTMPVYGKCSDVFGRKAVLLVGIASFVLGSLLCTTAWSMPALIAFRVVQGLGGGAINGTVNTLAGDLYALHERARIQAALSGTWAVASVLAPALGGIAVQYASWRWIFLVNVPIGSVAFLMLILRLVEPPSSGRRSAFDYTGAFLLAAFVTVLDVAMLCAGTTWGWLSIRTTAAAVVMVAIGWVLLRAEASAQDPIMPSWVWRSRSIGGTCAVMLISGLAVVGMTNFLPTWGQAVLRLNPVASGFLLTAMSVAWPVGSVTSARLYPRIGFRWTTLVGSVFMVAAATTFVVTPMNTGLTTPASASALMGFGLGLLTVPLVIAVQNAVTWSQRGIATGSILFARQLGQSIGAALFGALSSHVLRGRSDGSDKSDLSGNAGLAGDGRPGGMLGVGVREAVYAATHHVFIGVLVVSISSLAILVMVVPRSLSETVGGAGGEFRNGVDR